MMTLSATVQGIGCHLRFLDGNREHVAQMPLSCNISEVSLDFEVDCAFLEEYVTTLACIQVRMSDGI